MNAVVGDGMFCRFVARSTITTRRFAERSTDENDERSVAVGRVASPSYEVPKGPTSDSARTLPPYSPKQQAYEQVIASEWLAS